MDMKIVEESESLKTFLSDSAFNKIKAKEIAYIETTVCLSDDR